MKRGGLTCATFDISRVGDKSASVGNQFEFVEKRDLKLLQKLYVVEKVNGKSNLKMTVTNFTVADYEKEIPYRTGAELRKLGLGKNDGSFQSPTGPDLPGGEPPPNYEHEL